MKEKSRREREREIKKIFSVTQMMNKCLEIYSSSFKGQKTNQAKEKMTLGIYLFR